MRRVLAAVLVVALAGVVAGAGTHGTDVRGTVTTADGEPADDALVLVQPARATVLENATSGDEPVVEGLRRLANDPPVGLRVNRTRGDGGFLVHLNGRGAYDVVAVTEDGVSRLRTVEIRGPSASVTLTTDSERVLRLAGGRAAGTPGRETTVELSVANDDGGPVRNLTVEHDALPDGWSVVGAEGATYDADARRLSWDRVAAGETATATLTVAVPEDAAERTYRVPLSADADAHFVRQGDLVVAVGPPDSTVTATATPTDDGAISVSLGTPTPAAGASTATMVGSTAVFVLGVAVSAYAVGRTGMPYVGRNAR